MLRGGDEHRVDVFVFEQAAVIEVSLGGGRDLFDIFQPARIDIGGADTLHVLAGQGLLENLCAARPRSDNAQADTLIGAHSVAAGQRAGQTGCDIADEITARLHGNALLGGKPP